MLPPAVSAALLGGAVRCRAARSLSSHGGKKNRCKLPFTLVAAEPRDSLLPVQLAELLVLADERERRAAEAVAKAFAAGEGPSAPIHVPQALEEMGKGKGNAEDVDAGERVPIQSAEEGAAQALVATTAARRERAKATERAQATFAALPGEEERRLRRIKHNLRLIRVLILRPAEQLAARAEALVAWQAPGVSGAVLAFLQALVLHDCLRFAPAVLFLACAAQVMEVQRLRREGGAGQYTVRTEAVDKQQKL